MVPPEVACEVVEVDPQAASSGAAEKAPMPRAPSWSIRRLLIAGTLRPGGISECEVFNASWLWSDMPILHGFHGRALWIRTVRRGPGGSDRRLIGRGHEVFEHFYVSQRLRANQLSYVRSPSRVHQQMQTRAFKSVQVVSDGKAPQELPN
ncbi:hypothetical protein GCM10009658_67590 [Planotetraspora silvatica]